MEIVINGHACIFDDDLPGYMLANLTVDTDTERVRYTQYSTYKRKAFSRVLLNAPRGKVVDHINGNTLDNRKENLRLATKSQNQYNKIGNSTKNLPKGVYKTKTGYESSITIGGVKKYLGKFLYSEDAEAAYKKEAEKQQKEFAVHLSRAS